LYVPSRTAQHNMKYLNDIFILHCCSRAPDRVEEPGIVRDLETSTRIFRSWHNAKVSEKTSSRSFVSNTQPKFLPSFTEQPFLDLQSLGRAPEHSIGCSGENIHFRSLALHDLSIGRPLLGVSFITNLQSSGYTALTT